ncbi:C-X-C chemokine receptor type 2-like [Scleropages formosus]|uniref:C-X-C chemokine receptor type 2-like n=1 Tax=Scleropages formosus TaxID=113540 RepID=UPI00087894B8|nr:C-X-C chemokine receptor type 2-like [Scleropages formosus]
MPTGLLLPVAHLQNVTVTYTDFTINPDTYACFPSEAVPHPAVQVALLLLAFTLGFMGNFSVLVLVGCPQFQRASLGIYLLNLAANDLLSALCMVLRAIDASSGWTLGDVGCRVLSMLSDQALYTGVLLLGGLCMHSLRRANSHLLCTLAWVFGFFIALPAVLFSRVSHLSGHILTCQQHKGRALELPLSLLKNLVGFAIPPLLFILSSLPYVCFRSNDWKNKWEKSLILSLTLAFTIFRSPYHISAFASTLMSGNIIEVNCHLLFSTERAIGVTQMLSNCHCFVNPILYCLLWNKIREFLC